MRRGEVREELGSRSLFPAAKDLINNEAYFVKSQHEWATLGGELQPGSGVTATQRQISRIWAVGQN